MPRHFQAAPGRTLTLPQGLAAGPGATNLRLDPGAVVTVDDDRAAHYQRFLANRVAVGDLVELEKPPADAPAPGSVPSLSKPPTNLGLTVPAIPEKG